MRGKSTSPGAQRAKYVVTDFVATSLAFLLFNIYRYYFVKSAMVVDNLGEFLAMPKILAEQLFVPVALMAVYAISGYYNQPLVKSRLSEFTVTFYSVLLNSGLIYLLMLINDSSGMRRKDYLTILVLFGLMFTLVYIGRSIITSATIRKLRRGDWKYTTLIVGHSEVAVRVCRRLQKSGSVWGYNVAGYVEIPKEKFCDDDSLPSWAPDDITQVCSAHNIDQIVLALERRSDETVMHLLKQLFPLGIPVKVAPDTLSYVTNAIQLEDILGVPLVDLTRPRMGECQKNIKRTFDVFASSLCLLILSPLMAWLSLMVKLGSKGPVIYSQTRIGKNQKPFNIYKFRSMRTDAEACGPSLSSRHDPRVTKFGRFMRKYRLDELPQFWNVVRGDMSLVGPRPEREHYILQIMEKAPYYGLIFQVRPGITSWGMVKYGYASNVQQMVERSRFDLIYLNNMSIQTDIKIMIYTIRTIFGGKGM